MRDGGRVDADRAIDDHGAGAGVDDHLGGGVSGGNLDILDHAHHQDAVFRARNGVDRDRYGVHGARAPVAKGPVDPVRHAQRGGEIGFGQVEDKRRRGIETRGNGTLDRRAAGDAPGRGDVDRHLAAIRARYAQTADRQITLRHGVDFIVGTPQRRHDQRAAAQRLGLAQRRNRDVQPLAGLRKSGQVGRYQHGCCIFERRVHALRQGQAKARHHAFHTLGRILQAVIARTR